MANPEHLEILKQGQWTWWRIQNPQINPDLSNEDLSRIDYGAASMHNADLSGTILYEKNLFNEDFSGAILLRNAVLKNADLRGAKFKGTDLSGANLILANLTDADLTDADFTAATVGRTIFGKNDFSSVIGLETVQHIGTSIIGIDTLYRSKGNIPERFLRGCGVPEDFITYARALATEPIQFYTCFISFTEADDAFSERLYNDLQAEGVRCWRRKEDAKWGTTLMRSIDEAVRLYDKLIVICSEQSLNAPAVIREIERALQKEDELARQGQEGEVLFPLRLDDYIFMGWQHHRQADVTAKNVGDFTRWKEHDSYQKACERLLRDLKAEERKT